MKIGAYLIGAVAALGIGAIATSITVAGAIAAVLILVIGIAIAGDENVATGVMAIGFITAPMNSFSITHADAGNGGAIVADAFLITGLMLAMPQMSRREIKLPTVYLLGISGVLIFGLIASAGATVPSQSLRTLFLFVGIVFALPVGLWMWAPSMKRTILLASCFVLGEAISMVDGIVKDHASGRLFGYTRHPNFFGDAAMVSFGLCVFLWFAVNRKWRWVVALGVVMALFSVLQSGSRADLLACTFIALMFPLIERSAVAAGSVITAGILALVAIFVFFPDPSSTSAIGRLEGKGSASDSNLARTEALQDGLNLFFQKPIRGHGFVDYFGIHNVYLEVAVALGIFGLAAYILVLWSFVTPVLNTGRWHYLAYVPLGYIALGTVNPALYDRGIWAGIALSILARRTDEPPPPETLAPPRPRGALIEQAP